MSQHNSVAKPSNLRIRALTALVTLMTSTSTIAIGTGVPAPVTHKSIETMFYFFDKPPKEEARLSFPLPHSYCPCETTLCRQGIDTNNSQSWLNLHLQCISINIEETANHDANIFCGSLVAERNVYNQDVIFAGFFPTCQQWRYPLMDIITRDPRITNWIVYSRQLCCSGTIILFHIDVEDFGLLFCPWQLACVWSEPTVSSLPSSERRNQMLTDVLTSNSRNKIPVKPQSRCRTIMDTWTRFRLIRNGSTNQYSCLHCANLASCCCVIAKAKSSNMEFKHCIKVCIEHAGDAALLSCHDFDVAPDLADIACILVPVLWVPLVVMLVFLRQVFGHESQRCNTNSETVACGWYWCGLCSWIYRHCDYLPKLQLLRPNQGVRAVKSQRQRKREKSSYLFDWIAIIITCFFCQSYHFAWSSCTDIRNNMSHYPCLGYDVDHSLFTMACSFLWNDPTECIILRANETFEGNGHSVNLTGIDDWEGLFQIAGSSNEGGGPSSLKDAPVIHDVHMIGGETGSNAGGFIIQSFQKHFIVKHCSSSGVIFGGGICGEGCSGDIFITNCWSSGIIRQYSQGGGGIVGGAIGSNNNEDNTVTISHCYSTGPIGSGGGGICGYDAGRNNQGKIIIRQCYSLGDVGWGAGGGITGSGTQGHVFITDCYTRGDLYHYSDYSGGICGFDTGRNGGTVILANVYATGKRKYSGPGGLIGHIHSDAKQVNITMSVYDGSEGDMIGRNDAAGKTTDENNSGDLEDIIGTVYCCDDHGEKHCWDNDTIWQAVDDGFPILLPPSVPSPSVTSSTSPSPNETPTLTPTASHTKTRTPSTTGSPTSTVTSTSTPTVSRTPSLTTSETGTLTSSVSPTHSLSGTLTSSMTPSPSPTDTVTSTGTASPSRTASGTMTPSNTPSSPPTSTNTPSQTPTASASPAPTGRPKSFLFTQLPVQRPGRRIVSRRG